MRALGLFLNLCTVLCGGLSLALIVINPTMTVPFLIIAVCCVGISLGLLEVK